MGLDGFNMNQPRVFDHFLVGHPVASGFLLSGSLPGPTWQFTQWSGAVCAQVSGDAGAGGVARISLASGNQTQAFLTLKDNGAPFFLNSGGNLTMRALIRPVTTISGVHGYGVGMVGPGGSPVSGFMNPNQTNVFSGHTCAGIANVSGSLYWSVFGANASGSKVITETTVPVDNTTYRDVQLYMQPLQNGLTAVQVEIDGKQVVDSQGRLIRTWIGASGQAMTPFVGLVNGSDASIAQFDIDAIDVHVDTHQK